MEVSGRLHAPAALPPGEISPGTHSIASWVGPRADQDVVEKRKIWPLTGFEPPAVQHFTDYWLNTT
jgi:hypothetical protein